MEKIIISCLESRVEANQSIYARFLLGPFKDDNAVTIATALRRSLLSKVKSIAITALHIQGVTHEFSTIVGVRESVLDLALNFQQIVLRTKTDANARAPLLHAVQQRADAPKIGYLQMQGPAVIYANDLKLPAGIECVDPTQYIATLSTEGLLVVKFVIGKKKTSFDINNKTLTGKKIDVTKTELRQNEVLARQSLRGKETPSAGRSKLHSAGNTKQSFVTRAFDCLHNGVMQDSTISLRNTIFLDPIFNSVLQANYIIEKDDLFNQSRERIILEFWTNGSVHPRQALHKASLSLISTFSIFRKIFSTASV